MKEIEYIVGIYNYLNPSPETQADSAYYLLYLMDDKGMLDKEVASKLYKEKFQSADETAGTSPTHSIGPFQSVDNLNQFAFLLCEEMNAGKISLLSVGEYNTLLENTVQAADFHRDLVEKGNVMENIERKKKGLFGRFFS